MNTSESNTNMHLSAIHLYPLKGARAVAADMAPVTPRGLANDRLWMIVDGAGEQARRARRQRQLLDWRP